MKKRILILAFTLLIVLCIPQSAYANMAAPDDPDVGSSVTFERNDEIAVLSEQLDIAVNGAFADITATYSMQNTTDGSVSTQSMFLSPNIESSGTAVTVGGEAIPFTSESFALNYSTEVQTDDWKYIVLTDSALANPQSGQTVDTVLFELEFDPDENLEVVVSYRYRLGGYPDYDFDVKYGRIEYYLSPASMWKDFGNLTINLTLDEAMPVLKESSLNFTKTGERTYQYVSDTLPDGNLEIVIDESWVQNIFSTLRSPYLPMTLLMFSPVLVILLAVILFFVIRRICRKKK